MNYGDHNFIEITQQTISCESLSSCRASRARRVERVEPCCSTSLTQPKCMGSTRRVVSSDEQSGICALAMSERKQHTRQ